MGIQQALEVRVIELERERIQLNESLTIIREKIAKADEKYRADRKIASYHKWSSILSGLEEELDRTRAILVSCEAELDETKRKLAERRGFSEPVQAAPSNDQALSPAFEDDAYSPFPPEAVPLAPDAPREMAQEIEPESVPDSTPTLSSPPSIAPEEQEASSPPVNTGPSKSNEEPVLDDAVMTAMHKASRGRVAEVTLGEMGRMLDKYIAILHRPSPSPEERECEQALAEAIHKVDLELSRLHRKWIPYAPLDPE